MPESATEIATPPASRRSDLIRSPRALFLTTRIASAAVGPPALDPARSYKSFSTDCVRPIGGEAVSTGRTPSRLIRRSRRRGVALADRQILQDHR
ncbi:MAG TPA: hypothetical protein VHU24_01750, partial [Solirubrobacterales bacterium]|nr:hypothetical protein [Solirubrobacterales bacterium]